jgi:hypothetical protein
MLQPIKDLRKKFDKELSEKDEENSHLKNYNQSLLAQIKRLKNEKKSQQEKLEQFTSNDSMVDQETITDPIDIEKLSDINIQTLEKELIEI